MHSIHSGRKISLRAVIGFLRFLLKMSSFHCFPVSMLHDSDFT